VPKVLPLLRPRSSFLVGFKAEKDVSQEELLKRAEGRLKDHDLDLVVANDLSKVSPGHSEVLIVHRSGEVVAAAGTKREVADAILDEVSKGMQ
jgi:phosphopantothenoylcysteine decarboxylase/phosphopantothenate--cysteine ligase